jgi:NTE family protein
MEQLTGNATGAARMRTAVVLSAGGLRGAAHVGVLRQLVRNGVPIDVIVGVSAGAVIGAYYAAVGLDLDELIADAARFRGRHLLTYSVNVHFDYRFERALNRWCGVIPHRLQQLEAARFDRLHHGVQCLGIVCHDVATGQPQYFWTGRDHGAALHAIVRASASIPHLFPAVPIVCGEREYRLTDGGISDPVPLALCRGRAIGATHVIVSDCRWIGSTPPTGADTVWIRPRMAATGTLWSPRQGLLAAVGAGEAAVTPGILAKIRAWCGPATPDVRPGGDAIDAAAAPR